MRDFIAAIGGTGCAIVALVLVIAGISFGGGYLYLKYYEPFQISQHYSNVRHSIGFVSSHNQHARDDMLAWTTANAAGDTAHANADHTDFCGTVGQLLPSELDTDVAQWLAQHPCY